MFAVFLGSLLLLFISGNPPPRASQTLDFGLVHFENSCSPSVQQPLQEAIALLHSFEFGEATAAFRSVEVQDPTCAIAAWGVALANTEREGPDRPPSYLASGWKELQPWLSRPAKTERERMYLEAVSEMYKGYESVSGSKRWDRYIRTMRQLRSSYPEDEEASIFFALALSETAGAGRSGIRQRRQALRILLPIFEEYPNHPGVAHYILHAADTPELAAIALPAARRYAAIAPASPHALHMPSHIFSRLGYWQESLNSNIASKRVAEQWVAEGKDGLFDEQHASNHLEYAYLQLGQDHKAFDEIGIVQKLSTLPGGDPWWPVDARIYYDMDTRNWADALVIQAPASATFAESLDVFWIHSIAAARSEQPEQASAFFRDFEKSSSEFEKQHGWADLIHLELLEAKAWMLFAQQKRARAITTLREAVVFEQAHPIYYPDVLPRPSAEMLGDMFVLLRSSREALDAYKRALKLAPNRLDSLIGAYDAAARGRNADLMAYYGAAIASVCGNNADRLEVKNLLSGR